MYRSSLVRGPPGQSLRVDRRSRPPRHSTPSGGPAYEVGRSPSSAQGAAQGVGNEIGRDIKEGFPTDVKAGPSCTHFIDRKDRKKSTQERNAQRSTDAPPSLTAHVPSPFGKARFMNPCRFLKGCDALAAPSFPFAKHRVKMRSGKEKKGTARTSLHASTCGPSSLEREAGQRTRTPATEHNDREAHATVT